MNLSDAERRVLEAMVKIGQPAGPGTIGSSVWHGYRGSACSAPYARIAGRILNRLKDRDLVIHDYDDNGGTWGWSITALGRSALKQVR